VPFQPREVVFVKHTPYYGLGLYLRTEVEQVRFTSTSQPGDPVESLAEELAEAEAPLLFLVPSRAVTRFTQHVRELGHGVEALGRHEDLCFFRLRTPRRRPPP
jgi:hypothetical protein